MRILPKPIAFIWDDANLNKNFKKHGVTVQEAEEAFVGEPTAIVEDSKHSTEREKRLHLLGRTKADRKIFAVFTIGDKRVRIISIREYE